MICARRLRSIIVGALLLSGNTSDPASADPARKSVACNRALFRVVVDVGHTLDVPGAKSARGIPEYEFNMRLAKQIEHDLSAAGFRRALLLITDGPGRGLNERVQRANRARANLFLSIHHDSVPDSLLEPWEYDGKQNYFSDRFSGHSAFISLHNAQYKMSLRFARLLGLELKARGLRYTPHYVEPIMGNRRRELLDAEAGVYRYDQLIVLRTTRMPAVLLEAGSIVNRNEELLLATPEHQLLISEAVTDAVEVFCASRSNRRQPAPRAQPQSAVQSAAEAR